MRKTTSGFTIVELLIVIVVIAILAAITIVVYNGVQARAENATTTTVVSAYVKAFTLYAADNGSYPSTAAYPCLGSYVNDECGRVLGSAAVCPNYTGKALKNAAFDTLMDPYLGSKIPVGSKQMIDCSGDTYVGAHMGANSANPKALYMQVFLRGDVACPSIGGVGSVTRAQFSNLTRCIMNMPTLP
jgi:prepilin-type N-terminal cleavage/methylation domain-containing protein